MSGADIFTFTIREVPPMIKDVLDLSGWNREEVEYFVFHQANSFILNHLAKKMGLDFDRILVSLEEFGNTSVASIPVTIVENRDKLSFDGKIVLCGFGVGFSWASVALEISGVEILGMQTVEP
jgi:3-oxoacyl-[acyl-carrier-protein] synthase-3